MTLYGATDPQAIGQPISPFFGAQNGRQYQGPPTIQAPPVNASGPQQPALEAVSRGTLPMNALVSTVQGVSVGGAPGAIGGDPCSVAELFASGNGNQANGGVGQASVPNQQGEQQQYTVGLGAVAMTENGPTPSNVDTLGVAPVPASQPTANIGLVASGFIG